MRIWAFGRVVYLGWSFALIYSSGRACGVVLAAAVQPPVLQREGALLH